MRTGGEFESLLVNGGWRFFLNLTLTETRNGRLDTSLNTRIKSTKTHGTALHR